MCAIIGSFDKDKLYELYKLNSYRGTHSYSFAGFETEPVRLDHLFLDKGEMPGFLVNAANDDLFYVAHSQAPTTEANNIHPAVYGKAMLWHNGIIKQKSIPDKSWDTAWLLENLIDYGWCALSGVDGTFACILYNAGDLYVFRNELSPLFFDKDLNFSSTKFENSESVTPNIVYRIDLNEKVLEKVAYFKTLENPYYIPE